MIKIQNIGLLIGFVITEFILSMIPLIWTSINLHNHPIKTDCENFISFAIWIMIDTCFRLFMIIVFVISFAIYNKNKTKTGECTLMILLISLAMMRMIIDLLGIPTLLFGYDCLNNNVNQGPFLFTLISSIIFLCVQACILCNEKIIICVDNDSNLPA